MKHSNNMSSLANFSNSNKTDYLCIDPSCLCSERRINSLIKLLKTIEEHRRIKVVLPTTIYEIIIGKERDLKTKEKIGKTWKAFSMEYKPDFFEEVFLNKKMLDQLGDTLSLFNLLPASELVPEREKIGKESIYKKDVLKKLGIVVGKIVWEMMSISERMRVSIVTFGEKTPSLISRLGVPILKGHSAYKKAVKKKAKIQTPLRFMIYITSVRAFNEFVGIYEIEPVPLTVAEVGALGLLIVANG